MANTGNQKLKLLKIMEMLQRESDPEHPLSTRTMIEKLEEDGIAAERKSIYRDIQILQEYGMDIEKSTEPSGYYLATRDFELAELKLLVDAVSASKFITEKKARSLVEKLEKLASIYEGRQLQRQVVVSDRVSMGNERIFYAIDQIYKCIDNKHQMAFQYAEWNADKKQVLRHDGGWYQVSPRFLLWDNEYYYLVAQDEASGSIRHYRVDKIRNAAETEETIGTTAKFGQVKKEAYAKKRFGMFAGESKTVTLEAPESYAGIFIDRFGTEISIRKEGTVISVRTEVEVSPQFFGWLAGLGQAVELKAPEDVVEKYRQHLEGIMDKLKEQTNG